MFYNGPTPPDGIFDDFLAIPASAQDISTRSFFDLINSTSVSTDAAAGYRWGLFTSSYTPALALLTAYADQDCIQPYPHARVLRVFLRRNH